MIACVWFPRFALSVLAHRRADLSRPVALHTTLDAHATIVDCSPAARAEGVQPGMLLARALGTCPELELLDHDESVVYAAAERFLERLEGTGAAVEPLRPGRALLAVRPLERLYGGEVGVARALMDAFPRAASLRVGMGPNRFVAEVAAWRTKSRHARIVREHDEARELLGPLPVHVLPIEPRMLETWTALGMVTLADVAAIERGKMADRFGSAGVELHKLACGTDSRRLLPRTHQEVVEEDMTFPEAMGSLLTLQRAVRVLVERALARPLLQNYAPRTVTVTAQLVEGGSWRSMRVLREPTNDATRVALSAVTELEQIPAPVEQLTVRFDQYVLHAPEQPELDERPSDTRARRLQAGVRHVQAALDDDAVLSVLEVAPESRVPERRAVLIPADMGDVA